MGEIAEEKAAARAEIRDLKGFLEYYLEEYWYWTKWSGNEGQRSIYDSYMGPALEAMWRDWERSWPWVDSYDYSRCLYNSHYAAIEAWSIRIQQSQDFVEAIVSFAKGISIVFEVFL